MCVTVTESRQFPIGHSAATQVFRPAVCELGLARGRFRTGRKSRQERQRLLLAQLQGLMLECEWSHLAGEPGGLNLTLDAVEDPDPGSLVAGRPVWKRRTVMSLSAGCGKEGRSPAHTTTSSSSRHGRGDCRG